MNIILLSPRNSEESQKIEKCAHWLNWKSLRLETNWKVPKAVLARKHGVYVYGEPLFGLYVAEQLNKNLHLPAKDWLSSLPEEFLKRWLCISKGKNLDSVFKLHENVFLKPLTQKQFEAKVYNVSSDLSSVPTEEEIIMSEPVKFDIEIRFFILSNKVKTFTQYYTTLENRIVATSDELRESQNFIHSLLKMKELIPAKSVVVDVGKSCRGWSVIEANESYCSSLYEAEPSMVLETLKGQWIKE